MIDYIKCTKDFYDNKLTVEKYTDLIDTVGLWNSEKMIFFKYISKDDRILDLGCGTGRTTINLYRNGYHNIDGLDLSLGLIESAKKYCSKNNLNINFVNGDATKIEYPDNCFDVVMFSFNGMQCIPGVDNRNKTLKEVYRVLKKGGLYIFTAHNRDDMKNLKALFSFEKYIWDNKIQNEDLETYGDMLLKDENNNLYFIHVSSMAEMKQFISQENFEVVECIKSSDLSDEDESTKKIFDETVFWVLRKI